MTRTALAYQWWRSGHPTQQEFEIDLEQITHIWVDYYGMQINHCFDRYDNCQHAGGCNQCASPPP